MKRKLMLFVITILLSLQGLTQSSDSTIIATKDAKRVLEAAILSKKYEKDIEDKDFQIKALTSVSEFKDSLISIKNFQIDNHKKLAQLSESNYLIERNKNSLLQKDFDNYVKQVNKEIKAVKRKGIGGRILTGGIGIAIGVLVGTLLIK